jgi:hypothetical protein
VAAETEVENADMAIECTYDLVVAPASA